MNSKKASGRIRRARKKAAGSRHAERLLKLRDSGRPVYGALDLGTNNCRLLLAMPAENGFVVVDAFSRIVRLGEGVSRTGRLSEEAQARTLDALRVCANKLRWWKVRRARLIATQACRAAQNGPAFIERVRRELGLDLEVVDAETEARLAAAGACPLIAEEARNVLVFDIGGGSTELLWLSAAGKTHERLEVREWTSIPVGVVTLSERFGGREVSRETYAEMRRFVRRDLEHFAARLRELGLPEVPDHLLGTSGTVTTISGVSLGLRRYDRNRVDGCWLSRAQVRMVSEKLRRMSLAERAANGCIGPERADLVIAGCAILEEICAIWPAERIRVADRGLREGILTELMMEDGTYARAETT
ncbi:Ppx/GppA phosphatase family protein [Thermopetrobacter sp. TC1]|uniref:Ppx/GppA phosphatase family protein n=1 Tax=Thermopetrobacter sp. TC1 TaxID=1495045 RepID=UPI00068A6690|nr:Ppx/GppA phosphatase family protein [Thermopetrobacter sp. TC1]